MNPTSVALAFAVALLVAVPAGRQDDFPSTKDLDFESSVEDPVLVAGGKPYFPVPLAKQSWRQAPGFPAGVQHRNLVIHGDRRRTEVFRIPRGTVIPPHRYDASVQLVVVSGILEVGTGDKVDQSAADPLEPGTTLRYPASTSFWMLAAKGDVVLVRECAHSSKLSYARPEDDPRKATK